MEQSLEETSSIGKDFVSGVTKCGIKILQER